MTTIRGISFKQNNGFDIAVDNQLLLERVGRIIMTYRGERVNNPLFGSLLEEFLFQRGNVLAQHVEAELISTIEYYEPNIIVTSATVSYNKEEASIKINLRRKDTLENLTFEEYVSL